MELVDGVTLRERLAEGALETNETLRLAISVADGLARAHAAGIVHRDVKPDNVMITDDGQVKILDFGLAKQIATGVDGITDATTMSRDTRQGVVLGTIPYMSPEQAAGRSVDHRSDQSSFGAVLYEMVCGQRPFQGDSAATVLSAILRDTPPPPRSLRPGTPREIEKVVYRCQEKDPEKRYSSTRELSDALRRCLEGLTGAPKGLTLGRRAVTAALALLALAVGSAAWFWARDDVVRWLERDTLREINQLTEAGDLNEAWRLARDVQAKIPNDAEVRKMIDRITIPISIVTEPAGAEVLVKAYASPDASWVRLGETPLAGVRVPYALLEWKITREGFVAFEGAPFGTRPFVAFA